jgi:outer membrane receptor protein involved in Fe transport
MNIAGKIGAYTVYNFNALFEYQSISLSFRVNNIFNKNYYIYTVYQPMMNTEFFYPAPDRNFMLTLNYSLS